MALPLFSRSISAAVVLCTTSAMAVACTNSSRQSPGSDQLVSSGHPEPVAPASASDLALTPSATPSASVAEVVPPPPSFPPSNVNPPFEITKVKGDGEWKVLPVSGMDPSPMMTTLIHPHANKRQVDLAVVAIDLTRINLGLVPGLDEPKSTTVPAAKRWGLIPKEEIPNLVASTNGGFKRRHGNHGMKIGDNSFVPPVDGNCTVAVTKAGAIRVGTWTKIQPEVSDFAFFRQGGPCLVEDGIKNPESTIWDVRKWGASQEGEKEIRRSAYGLSKDGKVLYFAIGDFVSPEALADGMTAIGAQAASQFDINYSFTRFVLYDHDQKGDIKESSPLLSKLRWNAKEGWKNPASRDFFYMTKK